MFNKKKDELVAVVNENPSDANNVTRIFHNEIDHFMGIEPKQAVADLKVSADLKAQKSKADLSAKPAAEVMTGTDSKNDAETKKSSEKIVTLPGYVLNIPFHIDSDNECSSDESPIDNREEFSDHRHYFAFDDNTPPFRLKGNAKRKVRGTISMQPILNSANKVGSDTAVAAKAASVVATANASANDIRSQESEATIKIDHLTEIFETQSFSKTDAESRIEANKRLRIVIGLNRRESLIRKRNRKLTKVLNSPQKNPEIVHKMGFLWQPIYEELLPKNKKQRNKKPKDLPTFHRVRMWYKHLKKINAKKAEIFRKKVEATDVTRGMVPYREIREIIKNHPTTIQQINSLRQSVAVDKKNIYLGIFDSDTRALRSTSNDLGTFGQYDVMISSVKRPSVLSTGYTVCDEASELTQFAVTLDMAIRHTTAKFIGNGIYYPEPNLLIRVESTEKTVIESFINAKQKDYDNPGESRIILKMILRRRKLNPNTDFLFTYTSPVVTQTPERFELPKLTKTHKKLLQAARSAIERKKIIEKMKKTYSGYFNNQNKIYLWCRQDLEHIRDTSQSHFNNLKWAHNIWDAIADNFKAGLPGALNTLSGENVSGKTLKEMVISVISRIFNCFDPLTIVKNFESSASGNFVEKLSDVIKNYAKIVSSGSLSSPTTKKRATKQNKKMWETLDNANTIIELQVALVKLVSDVELANKICMTARSVGETIQQFFQQNLCLDFFKIIRAELHYFKEQFICKSTDDASEDTSENSSIDDDSATNDGFKDLPIHIAVLENTLLNSKNSNNKKGILTEKEIRNSLHSKGNYGLSPLHYAAASGNVGFIRYLKDLGARIDQTANGNVLPLHLAIHFCGQQGFKPELIEELANSDIIESPIANGQTPLLLAISTGSNLSTLEALIKKGADINATNKHNETSVLHECLYSFLDNKRDLTEAEKLLDFLLEKEADYSDDNSEDGKPFEIAIDFKLEWAIKILLEFSANKLDIDLESLSEPSIMQYYSLLEDVPQRAKIEDLANDLLRKDDFSRDETEIIREITGYHIYCQNEEDEIEKEKLEEAIILVLDRLSFNRVVTEQDVIDLMVKIHNELVKNGVDWEILNSRGIAIPDDFFDAEDCSSNDSSENESDSDEGFCTRIERVRDTDDDINDSDLSSDSDASSDYENQPQNHNETDSDAEIDYPSNDEHSSSDCDADSDADCYDVQSSKHTDSDSETALTLVIRKKALKRKWNKLQSNDELDNDDNIREEISKKNLLEGNNSQPSKVKRIRIHQPTHKPQSPLATLEVNDVVVAKRRQHLLDIPENSGGDASPDRNAETRHTADVAVAAKIANDANLAARFTAAAGVDASPPPSIQAAEFSATAAALASGVSAGVRAVSSNISKSMLHAASIGSNRGSLNKKKAKKSEVTPADIVAPNNTDPGTRSPGVPSTSCPHKF